MLAVYKPFKGERPLWDFPGGLFRREVAAYQLSETLGWGLVPETVERPEGPWSGIGAARFVHEDGTSHYFTLRDEPKWHPGAMRLAAFDVVANNADRRAATSSWPRTGCGPSTTVSASTGTTSYAR